MRRKLFLLVGMIASGKTTLARKLAGNGMIIIEDDQLTTMLHGGDYTRWSLDLAAFYADAMRAVAEASIRYKDTVIDSAFSLLSRAGRQPFIGIGRTSGVEVVCVQFPIETPETHASRRIKSDGRGYSPEKWRRIAEFHLSTYDAPAPDEGFDRIVCPSEALAIIEAANV